MKLNEDDIVYVKEFIFFIIIFVVLGLFMYLTK